MNSHFDTLLYCNYFQGWGCGYRSLQTLCSWVIHTTEASLLVPDLHQIQLVLVRIGDKPSHFRGSNDWIGSTEVAMCLDELYQV